MSNVKQEKQRQVVRIDVQSVHLCINLNVVIKVLPLVWLEPIPGAPNYVAGLFNLAGISIPIIDLALLLKLPRDANYSLDMPIILCEQGDQKIGFLIDDILGLAIIDDSQLQIHDKFKKTDSLFLGAINIEDTLTLLLNATRLINTNVNFEQTLAATDNHMLNDLYGGY